MPHARTVTLVTAFAAVVAALPVAAQRATVTIRLGTIAPQTSVWHTALREMGDAWRRDTGGRVALQVQSGDSEDALYRQMTVSRQLQAVSVSNIKLSSIDEAFNVFGIPLFYDSYDELEAVLEALAPDLDQRLERHGVVRLNWGYTGWVHVFSRRPAARLDDLKRMRLYVSSSDAQMAAWYRRNGFNPVPLDVSAIVTGLRTGQVDVLPATPLSANFFNWYTDAPHMVDLGLAPLVGATLVATRTWQGLSADDQAALRAAARRTEADLRRLVPQQDREAIEAMQARTLTISTAGPEWREAAETFALSMRGSMVPEAIYDAALRVRDGVRRAGDGR